MTAHLKEMFRTVIAITAALALLASPCLTMLEGIGGHAHHAVSDGMPVHGTHSGSAHSRHGGNHHGKASYTKTSKYAEAGTPVRHDPVLSCCLVCEGARTSADGVVSQPNRDWRLIAWPSQIDGAGDTPCTLNIRSRPPPDDRRLLAQIFVSGLPGAIPLYVLTQRYLI